MDAQAPRTAAQRVGDAAEAAALALLMAQGLRPLARNVRYKVGELDLVMLDGEVLVFVEVRRRGNAAFGGALASIDRGKARRCGLAASAFLQRHPWHAGRDCRFDVVGFDGDGKADWRRAAFTLDDLG